jgi:hypothetical protein
MLPRRGSYRSRSRISRVPLRIEMPRPEIGHIRIGSSEPGGLLSAGWGSMCAIAIMIVRTRVKVQWELTRELWRVSDPRL